MDPFLDWTALSVAAARFAGSLTGRGLFIAAGAMLALALVVPRLGSLSGRAIGNTRVNLLFVATGLLLAGGLAGIGRQVLALWPGLGLPVLGPAVWLALPTWVGVLVGLLTADAVLYAVHRWLHTPLGWPIHAIHHSDSQVNGFTPWRVHPLEPLATLPFTLVIKGWLALPAGHAMIVGFILVMHSVYVHLEIDLDHGPFRHVIASPRYHRWHHRDDPAAYITNLANMFPLFDHLFGTWREPRRLAAPVGAAGDGVPDRDFVRLWLFPFQRYAAMLNRWWQARKGSLAA